MGQGPQNMIVAAIMQHRNAVIFCSENGMLKLACTFIRGMGAVLPKEAKYALKNVPPRNKGVDDMAYKRELEDWIDGELIRVEDAISDYVFKYFERGSNRLD